MARTCNADLTKQISPVLGGPDPWHHLGPMAHPLFPDERDATKQLVSRTLLPGYRRRLRHPDTLLQRFQGQPPHRGSLPLPVDESLIS